MWLHLIYQQQCWTWSTPLYTYNSQLYFSNWCSFLCSEQLMQLYCARQRRRLNRGLRRKQQSLLKRLRKAKKEAPPMEKPEVVKTHLRDMVILPEMVGSMVGVYNGKTFNQVEIKVRRCWSSGRVSLFVILFLTWRNCWQPISNMSFQFVSF